MPGPRPAAWLAVAVALLLAAMAAACGGEPDDPPAVEPPTDEPADDVPADDTTDAPTDDTTDTPTDDAPTDDVPEDEQPPQDGDAPTNGEPGAPGPVPVVTEEHDGETIQMPQEGSVVLQLSSDWLWDEPMVDGTSVELVRVDYLTDPGYQEWEVQVGAPGVTTVMVHGEPNCANESACPPRDVEFRFEVVG